VTSWLHQPENSALRNIVECYWLAMDTPNELMVLPPAVSNDVLINFDPPTTISNSRKNFYLTGSYFSGVRSTFFSVNQHGHFKLVGIRFRPWVFALHFGIEPARQVDHFSQVDKAQGKITAFNDLRMHIGTEFSEQELVGLLDTFLLSSFDFNNEVQRIFESIFSFIAEDRNMPVSGLASRMNFSLSTLERLFRKYIGISPKALFRIIRYSEIWKILNADNNYGWTDLLYSLGYFDQSHFIREFKHFTGKTPEQYAVNRNSTLDRYRLFDEKVQFKTHDAR
jgi:AraC-like DNA-binding protein